MAKTKINIGGWAFMAGLIFGPLFSLLGKYAMADILDAALVAMILVIVGLIIGFMNINKKEAQVFMIAALVIGVGFGFLATLGGIGEFLSVIFTGLAAFMIPAGGIVAIKEAWRVAKS